MWPTLLGLSAIFKSLSIDAVLLYRLIIWDSYFYWDAEFPILLRPIKLSLSLIDFMFEFEGFRLCSVDTTLFPLYM